MRILDAYICTFPVKELDLSLGLDLVRVESLQSQDGIQPILYIYIYSVIITPVKDLDLSLGLDLVRVESLQSLDQSTVSRLLQKNYSLLGTPSQHFFPQGF